MNFFTNGIFLYPLFWHICLLQICYRSSTSYKRVISVRFVYVDFTNGQAFINLFVASTSTM